jgi:hypothetical protein
MVASRSKGDGIMCEEWWDERLLREQAEKLKRSTAPRQPQPEKQDRPERRPEDQPDPVPA